MVRPYSEDTHSFVLFPSFESLHTHTTNTVQNIHKRRRPPEDDVAPSLSGNLLLIERYCLPPRLHKRPPPLLGCLAVPALLLPALRIDALEMGPAQSIQLEHRLARVDRPSALHATLAEPGCDWTRAQVELHPILVLPGCGVRLWRAAQAAVCCSGHTPTRGLRWASPLAGSRGTRNFRSCRAGRPLRRGWLRPGSGRWRWLRPGSGLASQSSSRA